MKVKKIKNIKTKNTILSVFQNINQFISVKRIFCVSSSKKCVRGKHAHKKCTQVLISVKGTLKVEIINNKDKKKFNLKELKNYLIIPPKHWVNIYFKRNQKLLVLCDQNFIKNDYITDLEKI